MYEAILKRMLVAIVVRLLLRLKKPSRNDDSSMPITTKNSSVIYMIFINLSLVMMA